MPRGGGCGDIQLTAFAPAVWGSASIVTIRLLPGWHPLLLSLLRALPAGPLLLLMVGRLPEGIWQARSAVPEAPSFSVFRMMLFVSAYELATRIRSDDPMEGWSRVAN